MRKIQKQVGAVLARAPQGSGQRQQEVPVLRDVTDRVRAMADKYFRRPKGKR